MAPELLRVAAPALGIVAVVGSGLLLGTYAQYVLFLALIAGTVGAALVLLVGLGRVIMLATGAMMAIGAYASTVLIQNLSVPYLAAVMCGGAVGVLAGLILAIPAVRFRGHNLAMVTLVFQAIAIIAIRELPYTGGSEGLRVQPAQAFGVSFTTDYQYLLLMGAFAAAIVFVITVLQRGRFGKTLQAIAETEIGSTAYGIHINAYRIATFSITCGCLALVGGLLAPRIRIIDPETFGILASVYALAYPIVGGMTSVWGGLLGGGLLSVLPELLRPMAEYKAFFFAALVLIVMVFFPGGLLQLLRRIALPFVPSTFRKGDTGLRLKPEEQSSARSHSARAARAAAPALEIVGIEKSFGMLRAVNNASLTVAEGAIHGLIGPNGAGKTTLFNMVSGFITPDSGMIRYFGKQNEKAAARALLGQGIARTFQHVAVYGSLTCLDNVVLGLGRNGIGRALAASFGAAFSTRSVIEEYRLAAQALAMVAMSGTEGRLANTLSLGDQRRLEIARAIVSRPRLLLLDEPMSGVSLEEERQLSALLLRLNAEFGLTMFLIEHNIRFVLELCNSLSVMSAGAIIAEGVPRDVIANPEVRRIYFGGEEAAVAR